MTWTDERLMKRLTGSIAGKDRGNDCRPYHVKEGGSRIHSIREHRWDLLKVFEQDTLSALDYDSLSVFEKDELSFLW